MSTGTRTQSRRTASGAATSAKSNSQDNATGNALSKSATGARAGSSATSDAESLRLWLRLFTCTTLIERELGASLRREFGSSLPRFDLLAQLDRAPDGLRMGELSERILTTGGNVTWLVRALEDEGMVTRRVEATDRRAAVVRMTTLGRRQFAAMASAHQRWIADVFSSLDPNERRAMYALLGTVKTSLRPSRATTRSAE